MKLKEYLEIPSKAPHAWFVQSLIGSFLFFIVSNLVEFYTLTQVYGENPIWAYTPETGWQIQIPYEKYLNYISYPVLILLIIILLVQVIYNSNQIIKRKPKFNVKKLLINLGVIYFFLFIILMEYIILRLIFYLLTGYPVYNPFYSPRVGI